VLCPSDGTDEDLNLDITKVWPGKDRSGRPVANIYAIDTYNGYDRVHTAQEFSDRAYSDGPDGNPLGIEKHRELAEGVGRPVRGERVEQQRQPQGRRTGDEARSTCGR
jgi:hypothetical protein